jgi:hypothetical protein
LTNQLASIFIWGKRVKRSALGIAKKNSAPKGCATMLLAGCFELDVENQGNPFVAWLDAALQLAAGLLQTRSHSPSRNRGRDERKQVKGERL